LSEHRAEATAKVKEENPSAGIGEIQKIMSRQWNVLTPEERRVIIFFLDLP
jgi:hypothetical protein